VSQPTLGRSREPAQIFSPDAIWRRAPADGSACRAHSGTLIAIDPGSRLAPAVRSSHGLLLGGRTHRTGPTRGCYRNGRRAGVPPFAGLAIASREQERACGSAVEAANRSRPQQPGANHRSPSGLSDIRQQMAAAARALQAGGRPFEPGTAHTPGPGLRRGTAAGTPDHCCLSRKAAADPTGIQLRRCDRWRARQLKPFPRASRSSTDPNQIATIAEGIREGPNALRPAVEKISADAYLASPYVTDTMGETR
jgi:hypothetical protein